jgi:hypothetical protein
MFTLLSVPKNLFRAHFSLLTSLIMAGWSLWAAVTRAINVSEALIGLDTAILHIEQAVETPSSDRTRLMSFSSYLYTRNELLGDLSDLNRSILRAVEVVAATPPCNLNFAIFQSNMSIYLHTCHERLENPEDLNATILGAEQALEGTPNDHPL